MLKRLFASKEHPYIPGLDQLEEISLDLSGNRFSIVLPPNSVRDMPALLAQNSVNIYDRTLYEGDNENTQWYQKGRYPSKPVLQRNWGLYGKPWESMELATLTLAAGILLVNDLPESMDCFNPKHFESVLRRDLYFRHGPGKVGFGPKKGPVEYQVKKINGTDWCYYEVHCDFDHQDGPKDPIYQSIYDAYYATPIDSNVFLILNFYFLGYLPLEPGDHAMRELMNQVTSSMKLNFNNTAEKLKIEAQAKWPSATYSEHLPPEKWSYHEFRKGDVSNGEPSEVLVKKGSLPPEYSES